MNGDRSSWDLREFVESLADELERVHQVARVKAMQRKRLYTVEDMGLSLNVFAEYDGDRVRFRTAKPGEEGASKMDLKLGSITDKIVAETTTDEALAPRTPIEGVEKAAIKPDEAKRLKRYGVDSKEDVNRLARRGVRVDGVDFVDLARRMEQASAPRRRPRPERVVRFRKGLGLSLAVFGADLDEVDLESVRLDGRLARAKSTGRMMTVENVPDGVRELEFRTLGHERLRLKLT
ncbi:hypothetical protein [Ruegeria sp. A3M17]|uniref:hypothetical protein n=1 Tax=Ruegeria sp. A3M17 TaxID=2267229 RepID=UPI000DEB7AB5|nr:hypothetical protein [Ruegeria sp. A3M17]RBW62530.1 hypothetical protein DS906_02420 [Ruegeria sp. A3M17]